MLPERTHAQRLQDDEDHRQAMCGLSFDARSDEELEDFKVRHFDFIFAPGSSRARYPLGAKRGQVCEEDPGPPGFACLAPPPLTNP